MDPTQWEQETQIIQIKAKTVMIITDLLVYLNTHFYIF